MEIRPASVDDVRAGRDGRRYLVTAEAGSIAARLREIDPRAYVEFNEPPRWAPNAKPFYSVCIHVDANKDDLVFRVREQDFDNRVVERFRELNFRLRHGISEADRMDAEDVARRSAADRRFDDQAGEGAYALMRGIQKSILGIEPRVFMHRSRRERKLGV